MLRNSPVSPLVNQVVNQVSRLTTPTGFCGTGLLRVTSTEAASSQYNVVPGKEPEIHYNVGQPVSAVATAWTRMGQCESGKSVGPAISQLCGK